jgi:hypothetical protein
MNLVSLNSNLQPILGFTFVYYNAIAVISDYYLIKTSKSGLVYNSKCQKSKK